MPVICWGALGKAANDPTTIDQQIAADILAHNADLNAHGLNGYALYTHRDTDPLDHVDYSVTSDKITTNQIIGKDFRTAPNVGPGQDGVKFDINGIQMYQGGDLNVDIPVSGNPTFSGILTAREIHFLHQYAITYFESLDQVESTAGKVNNGGRPLMGNLFLQTYPTIGSSGALRIRSSSAFTTDNMFWETAVLPESSLLQNSYVGWGEHDSGSFDDSSFGFAHINKAPYAWLRSPDGVGMYPLHTVGQGGWRNYRIEIRTLDANVRYFVNGGEYISMDMGLGAVPTGIMYQLYIFTFNNATKTIRSAFASIGGLAG